MPLAIDPKFLTLGEGAPKRLYSMASASEIDRTLAER